MKIYTYAIWLGTDDSYKVHAEFESTGIKKLIKLFAYLTEMVQGDIVFIDELDSNLHDVYLCALLEYLMEYGEGQLCFTTHNVGPMDILKRNKMSIDFLSEDKENILLENEWQLLSFKALQKWNDRRLTVQCGFY